MPWSELLRKTVGVDPEYCVCGARMVIGDAINIAILSRCHVIMNAVNDLKGASD